MENETAFRYSYSAKENSEILKIRERYLSQRESKLEELKRLDSSVQAAGIMESLCAGIGGALVFGLGLCFAMQVLGNGLLTVAFGNLLGIMGFMCMLAAYPIYRRIFRKTKEKFAPRILELANELSGQK